MFASPISCIDALLVEGAAFLHCGLSGLSGENLFCFGRVDCACRGRAAVMIRFHEKMT